MQHSEKFVCLEYSEVELMIPQKDAFSAIFCDSSCFVKDKNGNGKTIFNSQWIPYIDLDKYSFSRNLAVTAQNPSCEDSFESVTKKSKKVKKNKEQLKQIKNSKSWKLTEPLRKLKQLLKK